MVAKFVCLAALLLVTLFLSELLWQSFYLILQLFEYHDVGRKLPLIYKFFLTRGYLFYFAFIYLFWIDLFLRSSSDNLLCTFLQVVKAAKLAFLGFATLFILGLSSACFAFRQPLIVRFQDKIGSPLEIGMVVFLTLVMTFGILILQTKSKKD